MVKDDITSDVASATSPISEKGQYDEKIDSELSGNTYDTKIPNMKGVSELPMYPVERREGDASSLKEELQEAEKEDLFKPFPIDPTHQVEERILTIRALLVGLVLGSLVNASNVYLGKFSTQTHFLLLLLIRSQVLRLVLHSALLCSVPSSVMVS